MEENQKQIHEVKQQSDRRYKKKTVNKSYKDYLKDKTTLEFNTKY